MPRLSSGAWQRLALSWEAIETSLEEIERDVENALLIMER